MKRAALLLATIVFVVSTAYAIADYKSELFGTGTGGRQNITTTTNGTAVCFGTTGTGAVRDLKEVDQLVLYIDAVYNSGAGATLDVDVEYSINAGGPWFNLDSFTQITTSNDQQMIHVNMNSFHLTSCMRTVLTLAGSSPDYDVLVQAYYRERMRQQ